MDEKKTKIWRLILHIVATACILLAIIMFALPFTKSKLTGENVYTGFELLFCKKTDTIVGKLTLIDISGCVSVFLLMCLFLLFLLLAFVRKTKKTQSWVNLGFPIPILFVIFVLKLKDFAKYTAFSIKANAMDVAIGAILSIIFLVIASMALIVRTFVFKEKIEKESAKE